MATEVSVHGVMNTNDSLYGVSIYFYFLDFAFCMKSNITTINTRIQNIIMESIIHNHHKTKISNIFKIILT